VNAAKPVYNLLNAPGKIIMMNPDVAHSFPGTIRSEAYLFLDKELKYKSNH
jgi:hypothetical protein